MKTRSKFTIAKLQADIAMKDKALNYLMKLMGNNCPKCTNHCLNGHQPSCILGKALSTNPGQSLLNELQELRKYKEEQENNPDIYDDTTEIDFFY